MMAFSLHYRKILNVINVWPKEKNNNECNVMKQNFSAYSTQNSAIIKLKRLIIFARIKKYIDISIVPLMNYS